MPTKIDYVDDSINYVTGCTKVSPACNNCYAEKMTKRLCGMEKARNRKVIKLQALGKGKNLKETEKYQAGFNEVVEHWNMLDFKFPKKPRRYFVNSMSDTFHHQVSWNFQYEMFKRFYHNPQHTFLIFTKRSEQLWRVILDIYFQLERNISDFHAPLKNVWIIATTENQEMFDKRMQHLSIVPSVVRGISIEPMLGPIDLSYHIQNLDWVIVGGETGPNAREMKYDWVESIRDQCKNANVPFWFKKWGSFGKKKASDLLDDKQYKELPL